MDIKLSFGKSNQITIREFNNLNSFHNFAYDCSKSQVVMRMTEEQYDEALETLEGGEEVNVLS